jgi:fatty-acyl-CoA synthase
MAALVLRPGATFDPEGFAAFLAEQADLGTKSAPRLVRIVDALPTTQTNKVLKRQLQQEAADVDDPVWHRPGKPLTYEPLPR